MLNKPANLCKYSFNGNAGRKKQNLETIHFPHRRPFDCIFPCKATRWQEGVCRLKRQHCLLFHAWGGRGKGRGKQRPCHAGHSDGSNPRAQRALPLRSKNPCDISAPPLPHTRGSSRKHAVHSESQHTLTHTHSGPRALLNTLKTSRFLSC